MERQKRELFAELGHPELPEAIYDLAGILRGNRKIRRVASEMEVLSVFVYSFALNALFSRIQLPLLHSLGSYYILLGFLYVSWCMIK